MPMTSSWLLYPARVTEVSSPPRLNQSDQPAFGVYVRCSVLPSALRHNTSSCEPYCITCGSVAQLPLRLPQPAKPSPGLYTRKLTAPVQVRPNASNWLLYCTSPVAWANEPPAPDAEAKANDPA